MPAGQVNQEALNKIIKAVDFSSHEQKWNGVEKKGEFPEFHTDNGIYSFYPLKGVLVTQTPDQRLPLDILEHPRFKALFPEVKIGRPMQNNVFSFQDRFGKDTYVTLQGENLVVEQKCVRAMTLGIAISHKALLFMNPKKRSFYITNKPFFSEKYTHWQSC